MNVIAYRTIRDFYQIHSNTEQALRTWYTIVKHEQWQKPQDVVACFGPSQVDILSNDRVCIDVKGNHLRVILRINYKSKTCFVRWIGWHKGYDKLGKRIHTI